MFSEHAVTFPAGPVLPAPLASSPPPLTTIMNEIVTPEQFFTSARHAAASWTGEQRLLLAVLEDAVANFLRYKDASTTRGKRLFREACEWFWSTEKNYLYTFETICDYLHLNPAYIRTGLRKLRLVENPTPYRLESGRVTPYRRGEL
jgi:hypothetical protein